MSHAAGTSRGSGKASRGNDEQSEKFSWETESEESEDDEDETEGNMIVELGFTKIVSLSTALWSKVVSPTGVELLDVKDFSDGLSELREFFVCTVCEKLVSSEFVITSVPTPSCSFLHLVCEDCQEKEWKKPCDQHPSGSVNPVGAEYTYLKEIVDSYKGFCSLFIQTPECRKLIELKTEADPEFDALTFVNHLTEGALATVTRVNENVSSSQDEDESTDDESVNFTSNDDSSPIKVEESECDSMSYSDIGSSDDCAEGVEETPTTSSETCNNSDLESSIPSISTDCKPVHLIPPPNSQQWPEPSEVAKYASGTMGIGLLHSPGYVTRLSWSHGSTPPPSTSSGSIVMRAMTEADKIKIRSPKKLVPPLGVPKPQHNSRSPKKGCRCGNATSNPGKLTCCGQRCPCYVARKVCVGCRCKGCRNPHMPDGKKRLRGIPSQITSTTQGTKSISPLPSNSTNSVAFQTIPEVPSTTFTSIYPVASYATFPVPVQVPISIVGISSIIQSTQSGQYTHPHHQIM